MLEKITRRSRGMLFTAVKSTFFVLVVFFGAFLTAECFSEEGQAGVEMLTVANAAKWKSALKGASRNAMVFDKNTASLSVNTFDDSGHCAFPVAGRDYSDFRIDCVVSFGKLKNKYSGLSFFLRDGKGKRYWLYWRPKNRGMRVVKIRAGAKTIPEYEKAAKLKKRPSSIQSGKDYKLSIEARGRSIAAWIDGKKMLEFVDPLPEVYSTGKIVVSVATCDLTLKSIKITDLSKKKKLEIKSYKYVNPPEKGDSSGKVLIDGEINGKSEQPLWWLATKGDPVIIFDLGATYFVSEVRLKAFAVPSANISAFRILGSDDGEKWKILAGEVNGSADSRERNQVLKTTFSTLARYIKLKLYRQAGDATIKLNEVEIYGREARPDDKIATSKSKKYYVGPTLPEACVSGQDDANWFYLESGGFRGAVSRVNGAIGPIYNLERKRRCVMLARDSYFVETRKTTQEVGEADNVVVSHKRTPNGLILRCRNKNIKDVEIIQTYKTTVHGIAKITRFTYNGDKKDLFLTVRTSAVLDRDFRGPGWYLGADRGLGGRLKASEVVMPMAATCHSPKNTKVVLFVNYDENFGIGQYRYAINGEYCSPVTSRFFEKVNHPPLYAPNGWRMGLTTLHLQSGTPRSVDVRWELFPEDEFNFFKQYTSIPEVRRLYDVERPDWLLRLKTIVSDFHSFPLGKGDNKKIVAAWIKRSMDLYDEGMVYMLLCGQDVWGDWYHGEEYSLGWTGEKIDNRYLRGFINEEREKHPALKIGLYTWGWTGWAYSNSFLNHPEWYIDRNKDGYVKKAYQNGPQNFLRRISAPGCMEDLLSSARKLLEDFDTDYFYIDGGGGGCNVIDWKRLKLDYDTDWYKFHWGLKKAASEVPGRERAFFTNARSAAFVDIGFVEGINNKLSENGWRESGDALLAVKMRTTLFPKMTIIPIYWRTNTLPFYSNYCIGLGLVPENIYSSRELRNVAYVTSAYETRMFEFTPAKLAPDWRRDLETRLEVYTMTHAPAGIFSIINHSKMPNAQKISADAERMGIDVGKPIFSWLERMRDSRSRTSTTGMSEKTAGRVYRETGWGCDLVVSHEFRGIVKAVDGRIGLEDEFDRNVLNLAVFTNSPAIVYSANGRRKQIWQPNSRGLTVDGEIDFASRSIVFKATPNSTGDVKTAELLVYVPNDWRDFKISGAKLRKEVFLRKQKFLLLAINGFPTISIQAATSVPFALAETKKLKLQAKILPGPLSLGIAAKKPLVTVYRGSVPVYFGDSTHLEIPRELESGNYRVQALVGGTLYSGDFTFESSWKYDYANIKPERKSPLLKETPINRVVNGVTVLKSAVNSSNKYALPLFTELLPDKLAFAAGSSDYATSSYGYAMAGYELAKVRILSLRLRNTFFRHWSNYDRETRKAGNPNAFAGLIMDYHTAAGYAKRIALGMGLMQPQTKATQPNYGKKGKPDAFVRLNDYIHLSKKADFSLDLARWAPDGWDGRVWISAAVNGGVFAGRKLFFRIQGNSDAPLKGFPLDKGVLITKKLKQPEIVVVKTDETISIDGKLTESIWKKATPQSDFKLAVSMREPRQKTVMYMCRDEKFLYLAVKCEERERASLISDSGKIWSHDALDITFAPLPRGKRLHKFVVNYENKIYQETRPVTREQNPWKIKSAVVKNKMDWVFEAAIPLKYLELEDGAMAFNLLRYRPSPTGVEAFSWSLIPELNYMKPKWFGTMILKDK